jgi:hypothetical protein
MQSFFLQLAENAFSVSYNKDMIMINYPSDHLHRDPNVTMVSRKIFRSLAHCLHSIKTRSGVYKGVEVGTLRAVFQHVFSRVIEFDKGTENDKRFEAIKVLKDKRVEHVQDNELDIYPVRSSYTPDYKIELGAFSDFLDAFISNEALEFICPKDTIFSNTPEMNFEGAIPDYEHMKNMFKNTSVNWMMIAKTMFGDDDNSITFFKLYTTWVSNKFSDVDLEKLLGFTMTRLNQMSEIVIANSKKLFFNPWYMAEATRKVSLVSKMDEGRKRQIFIGMPWEKKRLLLLAHMKPCKLPIKSKDILRSIEREYVMEQIRFAADFLKIYKDEKVKAPKQTPRPYGRDPFMMNPLIEDIIMPRQVPNQMDFMNVQMINNNFPRTAVDRFGGRNNQGYN